MYSCTHTHIDTSIHDVGLNHFDILSQIHQKLSSVLNEAATSRSPRNRRTSITVSRKQNPSTRIPNNILSHEPVSCLETAFISGILDKAFLSAGFLGQRLLVAMSPSEQGITTSMVPFSSICAIVVHGLMSLTLKLLQSDFHRPGLSVCLLVGRSRASVGISVGRKTGTDVPKGGLINLCLSSCTRIYVTVYRY